MGNESSQIVKEEESEPVVDIDGVAPATHVELGSPALISGNTSSKSNKREHQTEGDKIERKRKKKKKRRKDDVADAREEEPTNSMATGAFQTETADMDMSMQFEDGDVAATTIHPIEPYDGVAKPNLTHEYALSNQDPKRPRLPHKSIKSRAIDETPVRDEEADSGNSVIQPTKEIGDNVPIEARPAIGISSAGEEYTKERMTRRSVSSPVVAETSVEDDEAGVGSSVVHPVEELAERVPVEAAAVPEAPSVNEKKAKRRRLTRKSVSTRVFSETPVEDEEIGIGDSLKQPNEDLYEDILVEPASALENPPANEMLRTPRTICESTKMQAADETPAENEDNSQMLQFIDESPDDLPVEGQVPQPVGDSSVKRKKTRKPRMAQASIESHPVKATLPEDLVTRKGARLMQYVELPAKPGLASDASVGTPKTKKLRADRKSIHSIEVDQTSKAIAAIGSGASVSQSSGARVWQIFALETSPVSQKSNKSKISRKSVSPQAGNEVEAEVASNGVPISQHSEWLIKPSLELTTSTITKGTKKAKKIRKPVDSHVVVEVLTDINDVNNEATEAQSSPTTSPLPNAAEPILDVPNAVPFTSRKKQALLKPKTPLSVKGKEREAWNSINSNNNHRVQSEIGVYTQVDTPSKKRKSSVPTSGATQEEKVKRSLKKPKQPSSTPRTSSTQQSFANTKKRENFQRVSSESGRFSDVEYKTIKDELLKHREMNEMNERAQNELIAGSRVLAKELFNQICEAIPNRSRRSIVTFCRRKFHNYTARGKWTQEEDEELQRLYQSRPKRWKEIGEIMARYPEDCRDRYRNYVICGDNKKTSYWSSEEEETLKKAVADCISSVQEVKQRHLDERSGSTNFMGSDIEYIDWQFVSEQLDRTRSRLQCIQKWKNIVSKEVDFDNDVGLTQKEECLKATRNGCKDRMRVEGTDTMPSSSKEDGADVPYDSSDDDSDMADIPARLREVTQEL